MDSQNEKNIINSDDEGLIFEKLLMGENDFNDLQFIRRHMKYIIREEQQDCKDTKE